MTAFAGLVDQLFADPNLGRDATWEPAEGSPIPVRVVAGRADAVTDFGAARLWSETTRLDVRVAEMADPRPGDRIVVDGDAFVVQGEPVRDRERWCGHWRFGRHEDPLVKLDVHVDGDLSAVLEAEIAAAEKAVTVGVTRTGEALKAAWRAQVTGAGLGRRLANAIRANRYPRSGESITAASLVFSRAAEITDAFDRGLLIRSKHGRWLAIPTVEAGTRGVGRARITPGGWERRTGMRLRFVFRPGRPSLLVADDARVNVRGLAAAKRGRRRRDGMLTGAETVVIFILVPQVRLRKRLDLTRDASAAAAALPSAILAAWDDAGGGC
jgi:hypothetical protein